MLKKIIKILRVGRFQNYNANGDVEFKKFTTIFAENGRGKTTLSAIFRSLKTNDPIYITERLTLGVQNSPEIQIRTNEKNLKFDGNWDENYPNIEVFDSTFINDNVFSGEHVDHDHKKNLYRFVVGEEGVKLAHQVDDFDKQIRDKNNETTQRAAEIQKYIIGSELSIMDFLFLSPLEEIQKRIIEKEKDVEVLRKSKLILSKANPQKIVLPDYAPETIGKILAKQLQEISKEAEGKTKNHIQQHLDVDGESWLQKGISYAGKDCPFCGQNIIQNELIESYNAYFDSAYKQHKEEIINTGTKFKSDFSEIALSYVRQIFNSNLALIDFWKEYIQIDEDLGVKFEDLEQCFRNLSHEAIEHLRRKHLAPLDVIIKMTGFVNAEQAYAELLKKISIYNTNIERINEAIQKKKLEASAGDLYNVNKELEKLKNISSRYDEITSKLCDGYNNLLTEKKMLEKSKEEAKKRLDAYTENIFKQYQEAINRYLSFFGAGFEVVETKTAYSGGSPSSNYCIKINEVAVGLGDTRAYGKPCFRNILSQGDKNALAFAFFLARLDQDQNIQEKLLVFDDPISSLDGHRKSCTEQEIFKKAQRAKQCIVMSHDKYFLRALWNRDKSENVKALQIERKANGSEISEWDIMLATKGDYFDDFYKIKNFNDNGHSTDDERRAVARCIRPVLEGYLRIKFPDHFQANEWLGDFVSTLESSQEPKLALFKSNQLENLKDINDYSKKYHHKDNPSADHENINDIELNAYVGRTLQLVNN